MINISTQKETSVNQLLAAFKQAVGREFPVQYAPIREGDIFRSVLANRRCVELLGFCPAMNLQEGVARTYADYLQKIGDK